MNKTAALFASDLGLPTGSWPREIQINGAPATKDGIEIDADNDVVFAMYRQGDTMFRVYND